MFVRLARDEEGAPGRVVRGGGDDEAVLHLADGRGGGVDGGAVGGGGEGQRAGQGWAGMGGARSVSRVSGAPGLGASHMPDQSRRSDSVMAT